MTNDDHIVVITVETCQAPTPSPPTGFLIHSNVVNTFASKDSRVSTVQLRGLLLSQTFHLTPEQVDISTPSSKISSKEAITNMLDSMLVLFPVNRFFWRTSPSSPLRVGEDIESDILNYLVLLRWFNSRGRIENPNELIAIHLNINRRDFVHADDFLAWIRWYNICRAMSPSFDADYAEAISRPWDDSAAFHEVMNIRRLHPSISNLVEGEEFDGGQDSEELCPICLEGFATGSRVTRLPCNHMFHVACIAEWSRRSNVCPM